LIQSQPLLAAARRLTDLSMTRTVDGVRTQVRSWRAARQSVAFVPTMGNLHAGHLSLVRLARSVADRVVVSVFVNPTQFGPGEDYARYPRTVQADHALLAGASPPADLLFTPEESEIYPLGVEQAIRIAVPGLGDELCGASRPGHFEGVCSVVCRLLNIVSPDVLVLGEKDYQQLMLIRRMVLDLNLPVRVVSGPTQREPDGLAMSSRNQYLTPAERALAPRLHATLETVRGALRTGRNDYEKLKAMAVETLERDGFTPDYVEIRRGADLAVPRDEPAEELIVLAAAWLGRTRLIDNMRG
jgi:pantoate--beta-alanine ligase